MMAADVLTAPFPYYGGKRRWAPLIWERLGDPVVYAEPFAGSLACLLARPGGAGKREVVCDLDGGIANFWRATTADPEGVAEWCDWPTIHQDLTARHLWLRKWLAEHSERLSLDPYFYDVQVAGWWVWGISLWIGGGWCTIEHDYIPYVDNRGDGAARGVAAQRRSYPLMPQRSLSAPRPHVAHKVGGQGVSAQRKSLSQMPHVAHEVGGQGVSAQRKSLSASRPQIGSKIGGGGVSAQRGLRREMLVDWFRALQDRLAAVVVLNRSWESALTPTVLGQTSSHSAGSVGVLLDPPYLLDDRSGTLYGTDHGGDDSPARQSWEWALEHGDRYRVAYCCHEGDFEVPDGWSYVTSSFKGVKVDDRRQSRRDMVVFSPACHREAAPTLF